MNRQKQCPMDGVPGSDRFQGLQGLLLEVYSCVVVAFGCVLGPGVGCGVCV